MEDIRKVLTYSSKHYVNGASVLQATWGMTALKVVVNLFVIFLPTGKLIIKHTCRYN